MPSLYKTGQFAGIPAHSKLRVRVLPFALIIQNDEPAEYRFIVERARLQTKKIQEEDLVCVQRWAGLRSERLRAAGLAGKFTGRSRNGTAGLRGACGA